MVKREGKVWRVQVQRGGVLLSTTRKTKALAEAVRAKFIDDWNRKRLGLPVERTVEDALMRWAEEELPKLKSRASTANHAKQLLPFGIHRSLTEINEVWTDYRNANKDRKPATLNRKGAILRRIANLAFDEWKWLSHPIKVRLLTENNARHVYITKEELSELVKATLCLETRSLLYILFYSGLRYSELGKATIIDDTVFYISDTKSGKPRSIPIHPAIRNHIKVLPLRYQYHYYRDRFAEARERVGRPDIKIHDLRHSTASAMIKSGASMFEVRDMLGHTNIVTTNRYSHIEKERLRAAIERI